MHFAALLTLSLQAVIGSISGGTDIVGCFMGASQLLPVVEGECQCSYLGMDMASYNDKGRLILPRCVLNCTFFDPKSIAFML